MTPRWPHGGKTCFASPLNNLSRKHGYDLYLFLTEKVCLEFVRLDGMLLEYRQNDETRVSAVRQNPEAIKFVLSELE